VLYAILIMAVLWLAYSNGANDNFKGVATLYGSDTTTYRGALIWASVATLLGCLVSIVLARGLVGAFSGKGLIPAESINMEMLTAIGGAAAATIMLATLVGMPTSTTHALTGALVGAGLVADASGLNWSILGAKFAQPLLLSPFLAILVTVLLYPVLRWLRVRTGITRQTCVCIGEGKPEPVEFLGNGMAMTVAPGQLGRMVRIGNSDSCTERYSGKLVGIEAHTLADSVHYLSAGAVCFARAVNDTPKIAAILLATGAVGSTGIVSGKLILVAAAMVVGGLIQSRKVAETMSKRITELNAGQGLTANIVTAMLVMGASRLGMPVSTTHVSCSSIFGIGMVNRKRDWKTIISILTTWVTTLPMGIAMGVLLYWSLKPLG
jgi:PiT family inorganic phosphate transporter